MAAWGVEVQTHWSEPAAQSSQGQAHSSNGNVTPAASTLAHAAPIWQEPADLAES